MMAFDLTLVMPMRKPSPSASSSQKYPGHIPMLKVSIGHDLTSAFSVLFSIPDR